MLDEPTKKKWKNESNVGWPQKTEETKLADLKNKIVTSWSYI